MQWVNLSRLSSFEPWTVVGVVFLAALVSVTNHRFAVVRLFVVVPSTRRMQNLVVGIVHGLV
jgi:hypothetical protein